MKIPNFLLKKKKEDVIEEVTEKKSSVRKNYDGVIEFVDEPEKEPETSEVALFQERSSTWKYISEKVEARIKVLRMENDAHLNMVQTSALRGRIAELRHVLEIPKLENMNLNF